MRISNFAAIAVALSSSVAAFAGPAAVEVRGRDGRPLADAVVTIDTGRKPAAAPRFAWPAVVAQHNIQFEPRVLIVPVGATVTFPNLDKVRHHVYSFSRTKRFELKLYGREEARSVVFDKPGLVPIGCNIHDAMSGFILVVDTPYAMKTDAAGRAQIANVPAGTARITVWHPSIRAPGNILSRPITVAPAGYSTVLNIR